LSHLVSAAVFHLLYRHETRYIDDKYRNFASKIFRRLLCGAVIHDLSNEVADSESIKATQRFVHMITLFASHEFISSRYMYRSFHHKVAEKKQ